MKQRSGLRKAENTVDAYESDWDDFVDWCTYQKVSYFPATPETIVNYINDLADYAKANTISRRISAISENFNASGQRDNPCMAPIVKQALRGIRRLKGTFQQGKTPVLLEDIEDIIDCMAKLDVPDKAIESSEQDLLGRVTFSKQLGEAIYKYDGKEEVRQIAMGNAKIDKDTGKVVHLSSRVNDKTKKFRSDENVNGPAGYGVTGSDHSPYTYGYSQSSQSIQTSQSEQSNFDVGQNSLETTNESSSDVPIFSMDDF